MSEIRIDTQKAERIIAQILRDDQKMLPALANDVATTICRRLSLAMSTPTHEPLDGYRMIRRHRPYESSFDDYVFRLFPNADETAPRVLWEMVYDRGIDLPPSVADAIK